jgi:hypothetical protein
MKRIHLSRAAGWKMPANAVKVDRSTKWGNPFVMGQRFTREDCVRTFHELVVGRKVCMGRGDPAAQHAYLRQVDNDLEELRGKNLACWCPLDEPCHADVILELLVMRFGKPKRRKA